MVFWKPPGVVAEEKLMRLLSVDASGNFDTNLRPEAYVCLGDAPGCNSSYEVFQNIPSENSKEISSSAKW